MPIGQSSAGPHRSPAGEHLFRLGHWLLLEDTVVPRFAAPGQRSASAKRRIHFRGQWRVAVFLHTKSRRESVARTLPETDPQVAANLQFLATPVLHRPPADLRLPQSDDVVLLTNGIGGMARLRVDLARVQSKYDCVLGANLHPSLPVDRHIFAKRIRVWVNADGFISPLDFQALATFAAGPPAVWRWSPARATAGWWRLKCRPRCSRGAIRPCSVSAVRRSATRRANHCHWMPTCV
jgi:hypothetical protein